MTVVVSKMLVMATLVLTVCLAAGALAASEELSLRGIVLESEQGLVVETERGEIFRMVGETDLEPYIEHVVILTGMVMADEAGAEVLVVSSVKLDELDVPGQLEIDELK